MSILEALGDKAVWACLSAVGLEKVGLPPNASPIFVWADNDPAGIRAAKKLAQRLAEQGAYGVTLQMPKGIKDVSELLQSEGPEGIRRRYEEALGEISSPHFSSKPHPQKGRPSKSDQFLQLLENEEILLFHDQYRQPWVRVRINDHYENLPLESSLFRDFWLISSGAKQAKLLAKMPSETSSPSWVPGPSLRGNAIPCTTALPATRMRFGLIWVLKIIQ